MITISRKRFWLSVLTAFIAAFVVSVGVLSARKQSPKKQDARDWLTTAPVVSSEVKDLEIINVRINRPSAKTPGITFEIQNNSNKGVVAYEVACGNSSISQDGLTDEEKPIVLIQPHSAYTVDMNDELSPGNPVVLTGVIFDDGKEEGEESALKRVHGIRTHQRKVLKEKASERSPNQ